MSTTTIEIGTRPASFSDAGASAAAKPNNPQTLWDLLELLKQNPPKSLTMLKTTCSLLSTHLGKPVTEISIEEVAECREEFRAFLVSRTYAANSIRTFVNHVRILLNVAAKYGWEPNNAIPAAWQEVVALAKARRCLKLALYFARRRKSPLNVSTEDLNEWIRMRIRQGRGYKDASITKNLFLRTLRDAGFNIDLPKNLLRENSYGVPLSQLPASLRSEVEELLRWKQAKYAVDRPKDGRHRAVSAGRLRIILCGLYGFAVNILGATGITSFAQLIQKPIISAYVEWAINERAVSGISLSTTLGTLYAGVRYRASNWSLNLDWFKPLLETIPIDDGTNSSTRKAEKYLEYAEVETIPSKIRVERVRLPKESQRAAMLMVDELLIRWLTVLPWRQRNLRECRIAGPTPNLFKGKVPLFSDIDKPAWLIEAEKTNPDIEVWQFHFRPEETKTGVEVKAVLPRPLVPLLEEYLADYRPRLINGPDPGTLILNRAGRPVAINEMTYRISSLTLRHGGKRVNPHLFRDIVAFTWLKDHPRDFLTLSKLLWHSNINTTLRIYGSRFNPSVAVTAMEAWLEEREKASK